jgi:DNA mismatch repair protein MutL
VNRRFVRDKTIAGGLLEGYRSILPHGVYPVALLFIDVPIEEVDVNVHPAKTEIRFRRTEAIKDAVAEAVRTALARAGVAPEIAEPRSTDSEQSTVVSSPDAGVSPIEQAAIEFPLPTSADPQLAEPVQPTSPFFAQTEEPEQIELLSDSVSVNSASFEVEAQRRLEQPTNSLPHFSELTSDSRQTLQELPPVNSAAHLVRPSEITEAAKSKIRPIAQLHESFIIAVDDEGLLLIDQHVAHERILFDRFRKSEIERSIESQSLLLPETLDLSPAQMVAFELVENELAKLGFGVMRLSGRTIAIKSIPVDLPSGEVRNLLAEILDAVEPEKRGAAKGTIRDDIAASLACKAAVKINMKLTPEKMQWLVDRLLTTSSPTTCPHGRPVILRLTMKDIERGFHRS